jgi:hypothetical protein
LFSSGTYRKHKRSDTFGGFDNKSKLTFDDQKSYTSNNSQNSRLGGISLGSTKLKLNQGLKVNLKQSVEVSMDGSIEQPRRLTGNSIGALSSGGFQMAGSKKVENRFA